MISKFSTIQKEQIKKNPEIIGKFIQEYLTTSKE